ncbi:hypothetical protein KY334_03150 [Candidatus Woesearchaeota archaeon]|nr:hypothetical protein [Candidatus Woesearchaeota archaeon]
MAKTKKVVGLKLDLDNLDEHYKNSLVAELKRQFPDRLDNDVEIEEQEGSVYIHIEGEDEPDYENLHNVVDRFFIAKNKKNNKKNKFKHEISYLEGSEAQYVRLTDLLTENTIRRKDLEEGWNELRLNISNYNVDKDNLDKSELELLEKEEQFNKNVEEFEKRKLENKEAEDLLFKNENLEKKLDLLDQENKDLKKDRKKILTESNKDRAEHNQTLKELNEVKSELEVTKKEYSELENQLMDKQGKKNIESFNEKYKKRQGKEYANVEELVLDHLLESIPKLEKQILLLKKSGNLDFNDLYQSLKLDLREYDSETPRAVVSRMNGNLGTVLESKFNEKYSEMRKEYESAKEKVPKLNEAIEQSKQFIELIKSENSPVPQLMKDKLLKETEKVYSDSVQDKENLEKEIVKYETLKNNEIKHDKEIMEKLIDLMDSDISNKKEFVIFSKITKNKGEYGLEVIIPYLEKDFNEQKTLTEDSLEMKKLVKTLGFYITANIQSDQEIRGSISEEPSYFKTNNGLLGLRFSMDEEYKDLDKFSRLSKKCLDKMVSEFRNSSYNDAYTLQLLNLSDLEYNSSQNIIKTESNEAKINDSYSFNPEMVQRINESSKPTERGSLLSELVLDYASNCSENGFTSEDVRKLVLESKFSFETDQKLSKWVANKVMNLSLSGYLDKKGKGKEARYYLKKE